MSDLISREALLEAINTTISDTTFIGLLRKVIINAPAIEQGEVVGRVIEVLSMMVRR